MQVSVEIEVVRDAASLTMSFGPWLFGKVWADAAGAAKIGGLLGASVRVGGVLAGVELLGAARLRERLGRVGGRVVRAYCSRLSRSDLVERVAEQLQHPEADNPAAALRQHMLRVVSHVAPWAASRFEADGKLTVRVPRWLPAASLADLRRKLAALPVVVVRG